MNFRNLVMWAIIVFLTIGLYNMFKYPQNTQQKNDISFSEFLKEVDNGRVVQVNIEGNNISGVLSDGKNFKTYAPNDPNLVEKLSNKGVGITATPTEDKMPSLLGVLLSWFPMLLLIGVWIFFMRQMQGGKGGAMGFGRSKAKLMSDSKKKLTLNNLQLANEYINFYKDRSMKNYVRFLKNESCFVSFELFKHESSEIIFRTIGEVITKISKRYYLPRGKNIKNLILIVYY